MYYVGREWFLTGKEIPMNDIGLKMKLLYLIKNNSIIYDFKSIRDTATNKSGV